MYVIRPSVESGVGVGGSAIEDRLLPFFPDLLSLSRSCLTSTPVCTPAHSYTFIPYLINLQDQVPFALAQPVRSYASEYIHQPAAPFPIPISLSLSL